MPNKNEIFFFFFFFFDHIFIKLASNTKNIQQLYIFFRNQATSMPASLKLSYYMNILETTSGITIASITITSITITSILQWYLIPSYRGFPSYVPKSLNYRGVQGLELLL